MREDIEAFYHMIGRVTMEHTPSSQENIFIPMDAAGWNTLWEVRQALRGESDDSNHWDKRAKTFSHKDSPSTYVDTFLEFADIKPGESVFDMGCGTGNLSLPLGKSGHKVLAADFSEGMLTQLRVALQEEKVTSVSIMNLSWSDDWKEHGLMPDSYDVALASRSIATDDLAGALKKLTAVARRRACITLVTGSSPRTDDAMMRDIGIPMHPSFDDVYALAILSAMGYFPELRYITTYRNDHFDTLDDAVEKYTAMVKRAIGRNGTNGSAHDYPIKEWLRDNLVKAGEGGGLTLKNPRKVMWAFLSWDK